MLVLWAKARDALIFQYISNGQNPETTDFGLLWLDKQEWTIHKGRRVSRLYLTPKEEDIWTPEYANEIQLKVVKDYYKYIMNWNKVVSYERELEWLDKDWNRIYEKVISHHSNVWWITALNKIIRDNQFNVLRELWKWTANEVYINTLMSYYKIQIDEYIELWTDTLINAINAETDPTILAILNWPAANFASVKDAIIYQITP